MSDERTKNNAALARLYYSVLTDAAGYPNGMAYWEEMTPDEKYYYAMTALDFAERLKKFDEKTKEYGLGPRPVYGEGECKALLDYFKATHQEELDSFNERVAAIQAAYKASRDKEG